MNKDEIPRQAALKIARQWRSLPAKAVPYIERIIKSAIEKAKEQWIANISGEPVGAREPIIASRATAADAELERANALRRKYTDAPKPNAAATQGREWNEETVQKLWRSNGGWSLVSNPYGAIANAINAAIAAEREKLEDEQERFDIVEGVRAKLHDELAAEREKLEQANRDHQDFRTYWLELAKAHDCEGVTDAFVQLQKAREQLAALRSQQHIS